MAAVVAAAARVCLEGGIGTALGSKFLFLTHGGRWVMRLLATLCHSSKGHSCGRRKVVVVVVEVREW